MLQLPSVSTTQTFVSSPVSIPTAGVPYFAGITGWSSDYNAMLTFSVIDSVTHTVLGTGSHGPGGGILLSLAFTPTTTNPILLQVSAVGTNGHSPAIDFDGAGVYRNSTSVNPYYGVQHSSGSNLRIENGIITQGQAGSRNASALYMYGTKWVTIDGIQATCNGIDTEIVDGSWTDGVFIRNSHFIGALQQISNRMALKSCIYLLTSRSTIDIENNTFHITDEFSFTNGSKTIREDVVFLVNGIPVFFVETKAAHKKEGIAEALDQIRRYHRECPELLAVLQLYTLLKAYTEKNESNAKLD